MCTVNSLYQKEKHDRYQNKKTLVQLSKYKCQSNIITTVEKNLFKPYPVKLE